VHGTRMSRTAAGLARELCHFPKPARATHSPSQGGSAGGSRTADHTRGSAAPRGVVHRHSGRGGRIAARGPRASERTSVGLAREQLHLSLLRLASCVHPAPARAIPARRRRPLLQCRRRRPTQPHDRHACAHSQAVSFCSAVPHSASHLPPAAARWWARSSPLCPSVAACCPRQLSRSSFVRRERSGRSPHCPFAATSRRIHAAGHPVRRRTSTMSFGHLPALARPPLRRPRPPRINCSVAVASCAPAISAGRFGRRRTSAGPGSPLPACSASERSRAFRAALRLRVRAHLRVVARIPCGGSELAVAECAHALARLAGSRARSARRAGAKRATASSVGAAARGLRRAAPAIRPSMPCQLSLDILRDPASAVPSLDDRPRFYEHDAGV